jgi:YD repeat-containing protein
VVPRLRIFLSSPADTNWERLRAHLIIRRLARDYRRYFAIEPFLWEYEPMLASQHFQDAVDAPGGFDIVVLTVWSRLGTLLPEKTAVREYRGIDGRTPVTGTEWEFEDALKASRATGGKGPPDLLVYRRRGGASAVLDDPAARAEAIRQYDALEAFWQRWFKGDTGFLAGFSDYQDLAAFDRRLEADLRTLIERRIKERRVAPASPVWLPNAPFRGLKAYEFDDAPVFFGRHGETDDSLTRLLDAAERGTAFLLVYGPSGSGKSSLARAGLLPALVAPKMVSGVGLWRRAVMRPGDAGGDPIVALVRALAADGVGLPELIGKQMTRDDLAEFLASGGNPAFLFTRVLRELADAGRDRLGLLPHEQARLVLLIDQLEELVTRPEITAEQRILFARTVAALASSGVAWVIATVRSDLWHRLEEVPELRDLAERGARLTLAAPDAAQLFDIIRKPAQAAGLVFDTEPGTELALDAMLAREAEAQPGVLPLLSVMLDELYDAAHGGAGAVLTVASYRALGGLHAAIGQRAESRLQDIQKTDPAAAAALPRVLRALVTVTAMGDAPATRSAPLDTFPEASPERRLVDALIAPDARLLTAEDRGHGPEVRLAHEAVIENWPRAKAILAESGRFVRLRDEIDAQRRRWQAAKRRPELLLASGLPLTDARDLVKRFGDELSPGILAFINASRGRARRRQQFAAAASMLVMTAAGYGLWWWDQNLRIKTAYCASYGERWAIPFCVGPLDAATQAARRSSYRFRTQGGRVLEMTRINGSSAPTFLDYYSHPEEAWNQNVAQWRFTYLADAPGTRALPASVTMEGPTGVKLHQVDYDYSDDRRQAIARFDGGFGMGAGQAAAGSSLGLAPAGAREVSQRSEIRRHLLSFDSTGRLLRRDFLPATGFSTMADSVGAFGRAYTYDDAGLTVRIRNLDSHGNTLVDKSRIAERFFVYDQRGDMVAGAWLDRDGQLHANEQNFARFMWDRDSIGNIIEERDYAAAGELTARADTGFARHSNIFDARGNIIVQSYFDADGHPVLTRDNGVARFNVRYDERGNNVEEAYFGVDGEPILSKSGGIARAVFKYDVRNNMLEEAYFGTDGRPILGKRGYARVTYRYDDRSHRIEWANFGTDGEPVLNSDGVARRITRYDVRGSNVEETNFGTDGRLVLSRNGVARIEYRYDDRGNLIESANFGTDGEPVLDRDGVARKTTSYDERGNVVKEAFFGTDRMPVLNKKGYATKTLRHDTRGNLVETAYFGTSEEAVPYDNNYARVTNSFDERGNNVETAYFGVDRGSPPVMHIIREYDAENRVIRQTAYMDVHRLPLLADQLRDLGETGKRIVQSRIDYSGADDMTDMSYLDKQGRTIPIEIECRAVALDSVAARIGLAVGDRLIAYDDKPITSMQRLNAFTSHAEPGVDHKLAVRRGGAMTAYTVPAGKIGVTLGVVPAEASPAEAPPSPGLNGLAPAQHLSPGESRPASNVKKFK